ncbi:efflux RND transporter periplasmic adaptor subunit [Alteromonas sp. ASW11-19]|uniref:Efflux RND transporter periplasmic adaptor subunit n=1 Tax=Alteromonas salexigens TaxID=2982530 RepID=A0ABT2VN64_9ALTE|nr:efflux RND transporter periplasmic adaptor subunit [Alteromonas salexigens]MCU7554752.1 efflux RND transporter periplasmic adaptor subunit [Alteromonas salexigens]
MRRHLLLLSAVILSGVLAACSDAEQPAKAGAQGQSRPAPKVSVTTISRQPVAMDMVLPGRVTAFRQSQIRPQVNGVITERLFEEGASVEKGQQLYQIDDARYKAQLNSAIADLRSAEANLKTLQAKARRFEDLVGRNAVSQQEYDDVVAQKDQAQAAIKVAEAAVELARVNTDYTKVYAPISGQISRSYVTEGTLVTASQSQQLATITQLDPVYVDMQESGQAVLTLRRAMQKNDALPVSLTLDETMEGKYPHTGTLKFSEVTVEQSTGSVTLRALVPNPDGLLMPGMFVKAHVTTDQRDALLVPQRATTRQADGSLTLSVVNDEQKVETRTVQTAGMYRDQYIVTGGVSEGERVIVTGYQKVQPGTQVNASEWQPAGNTARAQ